MWFLLGLCIPGNIPVAQADTEVSGGLFSDTVWRAADSPFLVTSDVVLFPDLALTVEPDVTVKFEPDTKLEIRGVLNAVGMAEQQIDFIPNRPGQKWDGIELRTEHGGHGTFEHANISDARAAVSVECCRGAPSPANIAHTTFTDNDVALAGYAGNDVIVRNSRFIRNGAAVTRADKLIYDSEFIDNRFGLDSTERVSVYDSTFSGHEVALFGGRGELRNNFIENNDVGVEAFFEGFELRNNEIANNDVGVILSDYDGFTPPVKFNNIVNNGLNASTRSAFDIDVTENYWGTTDPTLIDEHLFDARDDLSLGRLLFEPYLTEPAAVPEPGSLTMLVFSLFIAIEHALRLRHPSRKG